MVVTSEVRQVFSKCLIKQDILSLDLKTEKESLIGTVRGSTEHRRIEQHIDT